MPRLENSCLFYNNINISYS